MVGRGHQVVDALRHIVGAMPLAGHHADRGWCMAVIDTRMPSSWQIGLICCLQCASEIPELSAPQDIARRNR